MLLWDILQLADRLISNKKLHLRLASQLTLYLFLQVKEPTSFFKWSIFKHWLLEFLTTVNTFKVNLKVNGNLIFLSCLLQVHTRGGQEKFYWYWEVSSQPWYDDRTLCRHRRQGQTFGGDCQRRNIGGMWLWCTTHKPAESQVLQVDLKHWILHIIASSGNNTFWKNKISFIKPIYANYRNIRLKRVYFVTIEV